MNLAAAKRWRSGESNLHWLWLDLSPTREGLSQWHLLAMARVCLWEDEARHARGEAALRRVCCLLITNSRQLFT
jgi:hypothetical protein